jgi:hypothetical protein
MPIHHDIFFTIEAFLLGKEYKYRDKKDGFDAKCKVPFRVQ